MTAVKSSAAGSAQTLSARVGDIATRTLLFAALWWLLLGGNRESWLIGVFAVPLAVWFSLTLFALPGGQSARAKAEVETAAVPAVSVPGIQLMELPSFCLFFLWQSLSGGWESARFAIGPKEAVKPEFLNVTVQLPEGRPRLYFLQLVNLLPGTVSVALQGDDLLVHALDREADNPKVIARCEQRIARLFGVQDRLSHAAQTDRR
jgi:multicomponent Na+:H+ antiporter subunit E